MCQSGGPYAVADIEDGEVLSLENAAVYPAGVWPATSAP